MRVTAYVSALGSTDIFFLSLRYNLCVHVQYAVERAGLLCGMSPLLPYCDQSTRTSACRARREADRTDHFEPLRNDINHPVTA